MSRPVLRVAHLILAGDMFWTTPPTPNLGVLMLLSALSSEWSDYFVYDIIDAARKALDIEGLGLDGLDIEIVNRVAPRSAWIVGGDDGEIDAAILRRWDAAVDAAREGAMINLHAMSCAVCRAPVPALGGAFYRSPTGFWETRHLACATGQPVVEVRTTSVNTHSNHSKDLP